MNQTPEEKAREKIDKMLELAGWQVQDKDKIDFSAGQGIAIREYQAGKGRADYVLFLGRGKPVGIIEAKKEEEGERLGQHQDQALRYAKSRVKWIDNKEPLNFVYLSTGLKTTFCDLRDPNPRFREVFAFHSPKTLKEWSKQKKSLRDRLLNLPELDIEGLRDCQTRAVNNLEQSFKMAKPRALIQMATGSGKTFTAITFIYRLLKFADAKRILFLVDTRNLGEQAEQELRAYTPNDDKRKFTELYSVRRLNSGYVPPDTQVCVSTIQRMYSILKGEELDEDAEELNPNEYQTTIKERLAEYNPQVPPEFFDFIVIDECHRSIYNLWRQVLDYFDAFLVGLTATPDKRTFGFFKENVVSEYTHEEAVADGVNVGHEVYIIETKITKEGAKLEAKEYIDKRDRLTRKKRWTQLDEELEYSGKQLDRDIVNPSQIRKIIKTFRDDLPKIFPQRKETRKQPPKTLIFAKNDSHADDIINAVMDEFGEGSKFCKKITYSVKDPKSVLTSFRNEYNPRIAVTVDMIATGTDVKPLECLLFMRDVKSKNYFEQMKGRGTRILDFDGLNKVSPSAVSAKTHFVIVDAIGVAKSNKTDSRPLERKKSVPLKDLLQSVLMGGDDEDSFTSLANRLARLGNQLKPDEKEEFKELAKGKTINQVTHELLDSFNPDKIEEESRIKFELEEDQEPTEEQQEETQKELIDKAAASFSGQLNTWIEEARRKHEQIIDTLNIDEVTAAGWDTNIEERAKGLIKDFEAFIEANKDEITALKIFYSEPYRRKELTFKMIKELLKVIKETKPTLAPLNIWQAYQQLEKAEGKTPKSELTALVALIRKVSGIDDKLTPFDKTVDRNFQKWVFKKQEGKTKFNQEQMDWLRLIKDHISVSIKLDREDLDYAPFDAIGGVGKMWQVFGQEMDSIIDELNQGLVA